MSMTTIITYPSNKILISFAIFSINYAPFTFLLVNVVTDVLINELITKLSIEFRVLAYKFEYLRDDVNLRRKQQLSETRRRFKSQYSIKPSTSQDQHPGKLIKSSFQALIDSSHPNDIDEPTTSHEYRSSYPFEIEIDDLEPLIARHNEIFKCFRILQETFNFVFLINFTIAAFLICIVAFSVTIDTHDRFVYVPLLIRDLLKIFFQCYFGQMLKDSSNSVLRGVERIGWENINDLEVRRSILIIMTRMQKDTVLYIIDGLEISLKLFTTILTSAYSYYTLLCGIMEKNEEKGEIKAIIKE
ncbi:odorant receptor 85b-like [Chironomus tepperi]|uniref:odorant receptor 85b-like n=1 Tax=Chironomus tepperi TaxID=113505 RepID=UPI00391F4AED